MSKIKFVFVSLLLISTFSFAQEEEKITPLHIVKFDVFKSVFSQLHFDYERYNGKKEGMEIGISIFYENPIFRGMNQASTKNMNPNLYAFQYNGYGLELKRKFYFP